MICFSNKTAKHSYIVGVKKDGVISSIEVSADTRSQAAKVAREAGYVVRDMYIYG
jgi:hypothetical protein